MTLRLASLALIAPLFMALLAGHAQAAPLEEEVRRVVDSDTMQLAQAAARRGWIRFRRATTLGPTLSVAAAHDLDGDRETHLQIGGGVALLRYHIPTIPTERLRDVMLVAARDAVIAQVEAAAARGEVLSEEERMRIVRETWQRIKDELLLALDPRHLEKPQFEVLGEVTYLMGAETWDVRLMAGLGLGPVYLAAGATVQYDHDAALIIPLEISVPVLLTDGLRSPVAQVFVRADIAVAGGDDERNRGLVGVRFALDVL